MFVLSATQYIVNQLNQLFELVKELNKLNQFILKIYSLILLFQLFFKIPLFTIWVKTVYSCQKRRVDDISNMRNGT